MTPRVHTARCYCGKSQFTVSAAPLTVAACHCGDCRRWIGAPVPVFAAFDLDDIPALSAPDTDLAGRETAPGVWRWTCSACGSPMAARFDYLPGQIYVPTGVLDTAPALAPQFHCHADQALAWVTIPTDATVQAGSARDRLNTAGRIA